LAYGFFGYRYAKSACLKIEHQIKLLLAVPPVDVRKIPKDAVLMVIEIFESEAEIAE
jgi:hypothetical protein